MIRRCSNYLFTGLLLLLVCAFKGSNDPLQELISKLENFRKNYRQEKVHLHFDKPYYSIGDTIYFKAYVVDAENNMLTDTGSVLHVDLIDEHDSIKTTLRAPIAGGVASGNITLADNLEEGGYHIRAYTAWMRNFDQAYFFDKTIAIGNALNNEINTVVTIHLSEKEGVKNTQASIICHAVDGTPFAGKEIDYSIRVNAKEIFKGSTVTNGKGEAMVELPAKLPVNTTSQFITRVKAGSKKTIIKETAFEIPTNKYEIRFFPEGGQLVNGLYGKVGIKAVDKNESGQDFTGRIVDDEGNKIVEFASLFAGMGSFSFTPLPSKTYTAVVLMKNGTEQIRPLPNAQDEGYLLSIDCDADPDKLLIKLAASGALVNKEVTLVAQSNHVIQYTGKSMLTSSGIVTGLSKKRFSSGITQFTLFDDAYHPVAERLKFIQHNDTLKISISTGKPAFAKREKVKIELDVKDEAGEPVMGNFSVAVTDAGKVPFEEVNEKTIFTNLLLSSDLRGYIEKPNYYFTEPLEKSKALDNLMLTQGWRRFVWKDIINGTLPKVNYPVENGITVSGSITTPGGAVAENARVTLSVKGRNGFTISTVTDEAGRFNFRDLAITDSILFVVLAQDKNGSNKVKIILDKKTAQPITIHNKVTDAKVLPDSSFATYLRSSANRFKIMKQTGELKNSTMLQEVKVIAKRLTKREEALQASSNYYGPGNADQVLTYEDIRYCSNLAMCLQGRLTGVVFKTDIDGRLFAYSTRTMGAPVRLDTAGKEIPATTAERRGTPMLLIVDGIIQSYTALSDITATDVQSIEVMRSGGRLNLYGPQGQGGVILITTKRGGIDYDGIASVQPNIDGVLYGSARGYNQSREFYAPDYSVTNRSSYPDLRSTIFWKPFVVTDEDGKATVEFNTADAAGNYKLIMEGMSKDGKFGRAVYYYTVQ